MPKPKTKSQMINALQTERRRLEQNLALLTPEQMTQPGVVGDWSIKDVLAHLADWESHMPVWIAAARRGESVAEIEPGLNWKQFDAFNQRIYDRHRDQPLDQVQDYFHETHRKFMDMVEAMSEEEMLEQGRYGFIGKGAVYDWLSAYAGHDRWAKSHLLKWMNAHPQGQAGQPMWYILQVYPGKERQVKEKLEKRFHTQNKLSAVQIVNPAEVYTGSAEAQNYAGLIFIQLFLEPALWTIMRNTPGVTGFVGMGNKPIPFQVSDWRQIPLSPNLHSGKE